MSYNVNQLQSYFNTAGKVTVITALLGVVVFSLVFLLNLGAKEFKQATAQGVATTSVTVLNTPPAFVSGPFESPESSTSSPTNSGDQVTWIATAVDSNAEDYYLLICDGETASPTANPSAPPVCGAGDVMWARSAVTSSGVQATAATTTLESFAESNDWYAWVCDSVAVNPRCNPIAQQGTGSTSSPFNVNHRPSFSSFSDDSPGDPGSVITFSSVASDPDTTGAQDTVKLFVCSTNSFSTSTDSCDASTIATSTFAVSNAAATYTIVIPTQDDDYGAYGFIVDSHGHESVGVAQGTDSVLTVNNVAPTVSAGTIDLNGGSNMTLVTEGGETTGFLLDFVVTDNNSCDAVGGGPADEIVGYTASVYRSGVGSSTCDGSAGAYNANNCYPSGVATTTWNLSCTASSTSCSGSTDSTVEWNCTFPLWYIADPTDGSTASDTVYFSQDWRAAVSAEDDDTAVGPFTESSTAGIDVESLLALNLLTATIPYGALEPGTDTGTLSATTTVETTGNTGLDESLFGESMCGTYATNNPCPVSATSTIPVGEQEFSTSEVSYGSGTDLTSSTSPTTLLINIPKSTSTSTPSSGDTYWGIAIPGTITLAGSYTGENTFTAVKSDPSGW